MVRDVVLYFYLKTRFDDLTKAVENIYDVKLRYIKVETIVGGGVGSMCTSTCGTVEWCGVVWRTVFEKKVSRGVGALKRIKAYVSQTTRLASFH